VGIEENKIEAGQHHRDREDPDRIVTVTRVWQPQDSAEVSVAYDIWEPGYHGPPGSWGSACSLAAFQRRYNTDAGA
jgi:hypothetical protein